MEKLRLPPRQLENRSLKTRPPECAPERVVPLGLRFDGADKHSPQRDDDRLFFSDEVGRVSRYAATSLVAKAGRLIGEMT